MSASAPGVERLIHSGWHEGQRIYEVTSNPQPKAYVACCNDPQFAKPFWQFVLEKFSLVRDDCVLYSRAGGPFEYPEAPPRQTNFGLEEDLLLHLQRHASIEDVIALQHGGVCGMYNHFTELFGARFRPETILVKQHNDLARINPFIQKHFPDRRIRVSTFNTHYLNPERNRFVFVPSE